MLACWNPTTLHVTQTLSPNVEPKNCVTCNYRHTIVTWMWAHKETLQILSPPIASKLGGGGHQLKSRNHVGTTIGCFLFIGHKKKQKKNFGSTIAYSNYKTCDYM